MLKVNVVVHSMNKRKKKVRNLLKRMDLITGS